MKSLTTVAALATLAASSLSLAEAPPKESSLTVSVTRRSDTAVVHYSVEVGREDREHQLERVGVALAGDCPTRVGAPAGWGYTVSRVQETIWFRDGNGYIHAGPDSKAEGVS